MPLYIKDDAVNHLAMKYQRATGAASKTEAVRMALEEALDRLHRNTPLMDRMLELQKIADGIGEVDLTKEPKDLSDDIWDASHRFDHGNE